MRKSQYKEEHLSLLFSLTIYVNKSSLIDSLNNSSIIGKNLFDNYCLYLDIKSIRQSVAIKRVRVS